MIANNEKPHGFFYLGWVALNATAVVIAWYITWALVGLVGSVVGGTIQVNGQSRITEDFLFVYVLLPVIGLLTGILQHAFLRRYLPRMAWWVGATLLGWLLPFVIGSLIRDFFVPGTLWITLGMFLVGVTIAIPQWWMLRQRVRHAYLWILAFGFGWCVIGLLNFVTSEPFAVISAIAVLPAVSTGVACWLMLDWFPQHERRSSPSSL